MARDRGEWLHAIAERADVDIDQVKSILASRHIQPTPVLASPRRLTLVEIAFSGIKDGVADDGPFEFRWGNLGHGLWAMLTDQNLRGKSSILEVVRWLVRGKPSNNLQDDVRRWIHDASLRFLLDGVEHEVEVRAQGNLTGRLLRNSIGAEPHTLATFSSEREFEAVMADFFMHAFNMESITSWRGGKEGDAIGQAIAHGWVAFSGAMFIGTNYDVLLGDMPVEAGLNARLMQMYLGLPWVSTLAAAKSALQAAQNADEVRSRRLLQNQDARKARIDSINADVTAKRDELARLPSDQAIRDALTRLGRELVDTKRQERSMEERLEREISALHQAEAAHLQDRRDLQTHVDSMAAGAVFRMLDPTCCPRCDHEIDEGRKKQEKVDHSCSVCGESISTSEDGTALKAMLTDRLNASKSALDKATLSQKDVQQKLKSLQAYIVSIEEKIDENTAKLDSFARRQELMKELAVLEGRLQEANFTNLEPEGKSDDGNEMLILNAIVTETDARVKDLRAGLLKDVSTRLVHYAQRFGMHNLSEASLKANGNLSLLKGGASTSYSKVTEGEKLRLKVATILAMIEVAEQRGVGRHPGLLMIDSPAAQEVSPDDVDQLVAGLQAISQELPHFQVFVAGLSSMAITEHVPSENRREALNAAFLW